MKTTYLDYAATTPSDPRVIEAMQTCMGLHGNFGNPASRAHVYGWRAEEAVENARAQVADLLAADPREIVWTSGATESNNLALKGVVAAAAKKTGQACHVITSRAEHKAVLDICAWLEQQGHEVSYLDPDGRGIVSLDQVKAAHRDNTVLVSLMHANNETGVLTAVASIGEWCRTNHILFHTDAAQSAGKCALNTKNLQVDLISISAHKIYGPKGIGALFVRRAPEVVLQAQIHGGGHERGMRSGTLATHQVVGMGVAAEIALREGEEEQRKIGLLAKRFLQGIESLSGLTLNGATDMKIAGTLNISFGDCDSEQVLLALRGLAVSSGSACTSASVEPSHVLTAMGLSRSRANSAIRFSFGRFTTEAEIDQAVQSVSNAVDQLKLNQRHTINVKAT